jgi:hypothetical protein
MKMADTVHLYPHYLTVDFKEAMYRHSNYGIVRLDEKWVKFAIHNFVNVLIRLPEGEKCFFPKQIKKEGKKVKEVFKFADNPMTMYELAINDGPKEDPDKWIYG